MNEAPQYEEIKEQTDRLLGVLVAKNSDYKGSAFKSPALAPDLSPEKAIRVRASDKIERIFNLLAGHKELVPEKLEDTMLDLAGYCILWLAAKKLEETGNG